jgi:hypothetical protein
MRKNKQGITKSPRLFDAKTRSRDIKERNQRLREWRMRDAMQERERKTRVEWRDRKTD